MNHEDNRRKYRLTDEQFEALANKAAERALQTVYAEVGKSVLKKLLWALGLALSALLLWLSSKGSIPK